MFKSRLTFSCLALSIAGLAIVASQGVITDKEKQDRPKLQGKRELTKQEKEFALQMQTIKF